MQKIPGEEVLATVSFLRLSLVLQLYNRSNLYKQYPMSFSTSVFVVRVIWGTITTKGPKPIYLRVHCQYHNFGSWVD